MLLALVVETPSGKACTVFDRIVQLKGMRSLTADDDRRVSEVLRAMTRHEPGDHGGEPDTRR